MAKVKAKAVAGKKKPVKAASASRAAPRKKPSTAGSRRALEKKATLPPARRAAGKVVAKKTAPKTAKKAAPARKVAVTKKAAVPAKKAAKRPAQAKKPVAKAATARKAVAKKVAAPARTKAATKGKPAPARSAARKAAPARKAVAKVPPKKAATAARRPLPKVPSLKTAPKLPPKAAKPIVKAAPKTQPKAPSAKVIPLKKPAVAPAAKGKPAPKAAAPRAKARPPAAPVIPPGPLLQPEEGIPAIPLRRPQVETPSATALSLAAATARLSARRVRDLLPVRLQTRRLVLRAPIRGDVPELVKIADNHNIADKLSNFPSPYTRADGIGFVEIVSQRPDERPYAIILDGLFIGIIGISFPAGQSPELGFWVGEQHWGQGYAQEAVRGVIDAAHQTREFPVIRAEVLSDNAVSLHILEKMGFKPAGKRKETQGKFKDRTIILLELEQPRWTLV
jgi:RimJ/RimL family protein N-acetyltransferase